MTGMGSKPAFLEKLNTSGMDKILAEYQTQLDAWLEAQGQ